MVRIKHRYLLFNILYPTPPNTPNTTPTTQPPTFSTTPFHLHLHRASPSIITPQVLLAAIRASIHSLFGDHGLATTSPSLRIVYFSNATSTCILRCPRAGVRLVWASLTVLDSFSFSGSGGNARGRGNRDGRSHQHQQQQEVKCVVQVVRVSGTVRKSEEELLRRARRDIVRAKVEGRGDEDGGLLLEAIVGGGPDDKKKRGMGIMDVDSDGEEEEEEDSMDDISD